jgi:uncharacterized membrane protein
MLTKLIALSRQARRKADRKRKQQAHQRRGLWLGEQLEPRLMLATDMLRADLATDSILRFNGDTGAPLGTFVSSGSGGLVNPHNPTFGPDGNLYVFSTEAGSEKILRYSGTTGAFLSTFVNTGVGGFAGGFNMEFGPNGDLYVATGGANVLRYNGSTGAFVGVAATGNGITRASGVEFGPDGNLYVLDSDAFTNTAYDRILRFSANSGAFIDEFVVAGILEDAIAFAIGPDGHAYVPDLQLNQTLIFNGTTGEFQKIFNGAGAPRDSDIFDIVWGSDGNAYATTAERVLRFDGETGAFLDTFVEATGGSIVFFPEPGPITDLAVTNINSPPGVVQETDLSITYTVTNTSASPTSATEWEDVIYISDDDVFDSSDLVLGRFQRTTALAAGASYTATVTAALPVFSLGDYRVLVVADRLDMVKDPARANNFALAANAVEVYPRLATSHDPDFSIAVGRTLSAYTTADISNGQLVITYTVYNQTDGYVQNVNLATTLTAGTAYIAASEQTMQSGQTLSWNLGRIEPLNRKSVTVTVSLGDSLQVDTGATASGVLDTVAVADELPAIHLRTGAIPAALLASTSDAITTDPFVLAKAAELDHDPNKIFTYLVEQVGYESYLGSLRGSRGTLWSGAGNSLDEAALAIALLRSSGIPARYVEGTLSDASARELIQSMFPETYQAVGHVPVGVIANDPLNDPQLLAESRPHFWVEFDAGSGFQSFDSTFAGSSIGDTFTTSTATHDVMPDELRHKVTLRLNRELTTPLSGLFGGGSQSVATVLTRTFDSAELVGRPVSIGHHVSHDVLSSLLFATVTNTYSPYLLIGDFGFPMSEDTIVTGDSYQEMLTNFPFGSQVVTGLFLEIDLSGPDGPTETYHRTLMDRIGFDIRHNGGTPSLNLGPDGAPALRDVDIYTLHVGTGWDNTQRPATLNQELATIAQQLRQMPAQNPDGSITPEQAVLRRQQVIGFTRLQGPTFHTQSDQSTRESAAVSLVKAYFARPRLTIVGHSLEATEGGESRVKFAIDLRRDLVRTIAYPGQVDEVNRLFQRYRGVIQSFLESAMLYQAENPEVPAALSTAIVIDSAIRQGIPVVTIDQGNLLTLDTLEISAEAKARISLSVQQGHEVMVPSRMVEFNGIESIGWFEMAPLTGETIGVMEDGGHGGLTAQSATYLVAYIAGVVFFSHLTFLAVSAWQPPPPHVDAGPLFAAIERLIRTYAKAIWRVRPYGNPDDPAVFEFLSGFLNPADMRVHRAEASKSINATLSGEVLLVTGSPASVTADQNTPASFSINVQTSLTDEYTLVAEAPEGWHVELTDAGLVTVTPALGLQGGSLPMRVFARSVRNPALLAHAEVTVNIQPTLPAVSLTVEQDNFFFVSVNGGQLPSVFEARFTNLGPASEPFEVAFSGVPAGFEVISTLPSATVPAGSQGIVGLHLNPIAPLPPPGTDASFTVIVTGRNSGATDTQLVTFTIPEVHGVVLTSAPTEVSTTPGIAIDAVVSIESRGNVPETVNLTVETTGGLVVDGLQQVTLTPGERRQLSLTLTPPAGTPLNSTLSVKIFAMFDGREPVELIVPVHVAAPGVLSVSRSATAAQELGNEALADRLTDLAVTLTKLTEQPLNEIFQIQAIASLDSILSLLANDPILAPFVPELTSARDDLAAAATEAEVLSALNGVGAALDEFAATIVNLALHQPQFVMLSAPQTALPGSPATFEARLRNIGTTTTTYNVSVGTLPAGVTGQITTPAQVTLAPGAFTSVFVSITPPVNEVFPFEFQIDAAVAGVPQIVQSATGILSARREVVSVASVLVDPSFGNPGTLSSVTVRLLNAVNRPQAALVHFQVFSPTNAVVFTSDNYPVDLNVQDSLTSISLGTVSTAGFAKGQYRVVVTVTDTLGNPLLGATGEGDLLVGLPVTAELVVDPRNLPPGDSVVNNSLTVSTTAAPFPPVSLIGVGAAGNATDVALFGNLAYVATTSAISVFDVADPMNPVFLRTFGGGTRDVEIRNNQLVALGIAQSPLTLAIYSLAGDPSNPTLLGSTPDLPYFGAFDMILTDTHAYVAALQFLFFPGNIIAQSGDLISINISNPTAPVLDDVLINTFGTNVDGVGVAGGIDQSGGQFNVFHVEQVDANTLYIASTTSTGGDPQIGVGRVRVVDISNPANMSIVSEVQIPGTVQVGVIAIDGNQAYVLASSGGWDEVDISHGLLGNVVLATLDMTDHRAPLLINTQTFPQPSRGLGATFEPVGENLLAFGSVETVEDGTMTLVDITNPLALTTSIVPTPAIEGIEGRNGLIYTADIGGLKIYQLGAPPPLVTTANIQIPTDAGVDVISGSFQLEGVSVTPTVIAGVGFNTYQVNVPLTRDSLSQTITWQTSVTGMQPGETRDVTLDTTVAFTLGGTPGAVTLNPQQVFAEQIMGLEPDTQTVAPGEAAEFTVRIDNPTDLPVTYDLAVLGVPSEWVQLESEIFVAPNSFALVPLTLASEDFAALTSYGFTVTATVDGVIGSVQGTLQLEGAPVLPVASPEAHGVDVSLTPQSAVVGQGGNGKYTVRITNPGSVPEPYVLFVSGLPEGFTATFGQQFVELAPGVSNYFDVPLTITAPVGTVPGAFPFTVTAAGFNDATITDVASATLEVLGLGVTLDIQPATVMPDSVFQMLVTNRGGSTDTFDLTLGGPAALVASLGAQSITLGPGASQLVSITLGGIDFATPGGLSLSAVAISRTNNVVQASDLTVVAIAETFGLSAGFTEHEAQLDAPGKVSFLLQIENTGNVEDSYAVEIVSTSGAVLASFLNPVQRSSTNIFPELILPGLAGGLLKLDVELLSGVGTVTVQVRSLTNDSLIATDTVTVALRQASDDFGDAPDSYGTSLATGGARHLATGPRLGAARDIELDGQPTATALGDDSFGEVDDEDGVSFPGILVAGSCDCAGTGLGNAITVNASEAGFLDAWIDFNRNGRFDANEQVAASLPVSAGANALTVSVPDSASAGASFARFRISSAGGLGPIGAATDGEVEDYAVQIFNPTQGSSGVIADPNNPAARVLYIKGTSFSDAIVVRQTSSTMVTVYVSPFGTSSSFALSSFDRIVICAGAGSDSISIEKPISKPSVIYGDEDNDSISGGLGPDIIFGGPGVDSIAGNAGNDTISGGPGKDSLSGGDGIDRLLESGSGPMSLSNTQFKIGGENNALGYFEVATLLGGDGSDVFDATGWSWPLTINGGGGANTLVDGGNANFTLTETSLARIIGTTTRTISMAGIKNVVLTGGAGNNTFNLSAWPFTATLNGATGTDTFLATGDGDFTLTDSMLLRSALGTIRLSGLEQATLTGGASANTFNVGAWTNAATLSAGGGVDKLIVSDNVSTTLSNTSLTRTGRGTITLSSFEAAEIIDGAGNNTITATNFSGELKVDGGAGNDTITGGAGPSLLIGGLGNDTLRSGTGRTVLIGGQGLDKLTGGNNDDLLISGQTVHDNNAVALAMILAEWAAVATSYVDRVAHLTGTLGGGLNGTNRLDGVNVLHDNAVDILLGGPGADLFFAKKTSQTGLPKDSFADKSATEFVLDLI